MENVAETKKPRRAAAAALAEVGRGARLDRALERTVRRRYGRRDASFAEELVKCVVRHRALIDYQLGQVAARPGKKLPPPVRDIMRMAAAELFFMRTPTYAAVDEAVAAVRDSPFTGLAPFVNGALRRLASRDTLAEPTGDDADALGIRYSHPAWLVRRWLDRLGPEETRALLKADNDVVPLSIYPNPVNAGTDTLAAAVRAEGCRVAAGAYGSLSLDLGGKRLRELRAFRDGSFFVLDPASTAGPRWLSPPTGATVLDLCAGVGGKSVQLAGAVGPEGRVIAVDRDGRKLKECAALAGRLGLSNVETRAADVLNDELPSAEYAFLDAPCTNLGVVRRKVDVKWRVREEDVATAAATEENLLGRAVDLLAAGGVLVYNVCTLEPEETDRVVSRVAGSRDVEVVEYYGGDFDDARDGPYLRTWPHRHGCNGGFAAMLRRPA
jgi:16S rRNA (cytosine967-C5)-methyltransferase